MKRKKLIAFLLAHCIGLSFGHAQVSQPEMVGLPNVLPPTPEAFALGKFGNNQIGLFTGTVQYAVPIYNINTGSITIPLSISYSSNGVKVDEVSSRVGMQWKMDFAGVINRTVHGMPDEISQSRTTSHDTSSAAFYNFFKAAGDAPTALDIQPDEYSFSFPGYSGKFFFKNNQPIAIAVSNIEIEKDSSIFIITTPDGTKYYFGENLAYDNSRTISGPGNCSSDAFTAGYTTAWYLTRIVLRSGETVTYVYESINGASEVEYPTGVSQTFNFIPYGTYGEALGWNTTPLVLCSQTTPSVDPLRTCYQVIAYSGAKLKEIQFSQGTARLVYSSRDDIPGEKKLDSLIIENAEGLTIKRCAFSYSYSTYSAATYDATIPGYSTVQSVYPELRKRLFLTKVQDCTISSDTANKYLFEYDDYNALPPRLSYAQDFWGYFNGKQNALFYPNYTMAHIYYWGPPSQGGDRTPSFSHCKKGVLTKITYPTGGASNYTYEANTLGAGYNIIKPTYDTIPFSGNLGDPPTPYTSSTFSLNATTFWVKIESDAAVDPPTEMDPFQYDSLIHVKLTDQYANVYFENTVPIRAIYEFYQNYTPYADRQYTLLIESDYPNVSYTVTIYSEDPNASYPYYDQAAGVRVAEVYDEDGLGNVQNHRVFKYYKWETPGTSSGTSIDFTMWDDLYYAACRTIEQGEPDWQCSYMQFQSNSQYSLYRSSFASVNYSHVIELMKDGTGTFTGGTEHKFQVEQQTRPIKWGANEGEYVWDFAKTAVPGCPNSNTDLFNGTEVETKVFTLSSPTSRTIRQHSKNYFSVDSRRVTIDTLYAIRKVKTRDTYTPQWKYFNDYDINTYFVYSKWNHLDSTIATTYTSSGDSMVAKTQYVYDNAAHLMPTVVRAWDSKKELRLVKKKYPGEIDTLPGPTYVMLTGKDKTEAVRERFYKDTSFLFTKYTKYKTWSTNVVEPEYTEVAGPTEVMSKVEFYDYTTQAKLKEVSKPGDVRMSYIWDTIYNYPLAEVQNGSIADIAFTGFESNSQGSWSYNNSYINASNFITGSKGFNLSSGSITRNSLSSSKEYIVSLWATGSVSVSGGTLTITGKTIGSWTNYIFKVTGVTSTTVSGSGYIDELRLHPAGSQMKSYSYKLLTGVCTVADVNNRLAYYEYDAAGRLTVVKDQDGFVLKKYDYKYQSQQ